MSYTSLNFVLFVAAAALAYFLFPWKKHQWTVLLAASCVFYLFMGFRPALFLAFSIVSVHLTALWLGCMAVDAKKVIQDHKEDWGRDEKKAYKQRVARKKCAVMLASVVANLGILCFLKYYGFLAQSLNSLLSGTGFALPQWPLLLPLGISFYTFQAVGYVLDVYHEKVEAEKNVFKVALFLSFFPQIVQGPISFYGQLAHQLYEPHRFSWRRACHACELMLWGAFKKIVIADRAYIAIRTVLNGYDQFSGATLGFTVLLYALQLYADFSGGIDISRGVAQLFGIDMVQNFRRPYFAADINDYWRRWHISLGAWMKEYVFYPLALSRRFAALSKRIRASRFGRTPAGAHTAKVLPTSIASLIVFLLVGIWHGANWKYVGFGLWNGGVIMLSTLMEPLFAETARRLHINTRSAGYRLFQILRTFLIVLVGYVFDIAPDLAGSLHTIRRILFAPGFALAGQEIFALGLDHADFWVLGVGAVILFLVSLWQERSGKSLREYLDAKPCILRYSLVLGCVLTLLIFGIYGPGYNATDFVYMQF